MKASQPVTLPDTERHAVSSIDVGDTFDILVALPHGYASSAEAYPVLYLLDANGLFGMTTETLRLLNFFGGMRDVIVVGIGYPGVSSFPATMGIRTRDYTPTDEAWYLTEYRRGADADGYAGEGGAAAFLAFLSGELMPYAERAFRTTDERAIVGYSFGGLFALYALLTKPILFDRYFICSPSLWWGGGVITKIERAYAASHDDLPAWVWMAVGSDEDQDMTVPMLDLAAVLTSRGYPSLSVSATVLTGEEHLSVFPGFLSRALRAAYARPRRLR